MGRPCRLLLPSLITNTQPWQKSQAAALLLSVIVLTVVGCGGSTPTTTTAHKNADAQAAMSLGHRMATTMEVFGLPPSAVVRRFGDSFKRLSTHEQRLAMRAAARSFDAQGKPLTSGQSGAVLDALGRIRSLGQ